MFKKNNFKLLALLLGGFALIYFFSANAEEGSPEDLRWHICAEKNYLQWQQKDYVDQNADVCEFLGNEPGPSCDQTIMGLYSIGNLERAMQTFYMQVVVMPNCGQHPE